MTDTVHTLLAQCVHGKGPADFVFTREDGKPVRDFRKAWGNLCAAAGVSGLEVHDMRRTGARNFRRDGIAESVIMKIGGWKKPGPSLGMITGMIHPKPTQTANWGGSTK